MTELNSRDFAIAVSLRVVGIIVFFFCSLIFPLYSISCHGIAFPAGAVFNGTISDILATRITLFDVSWENSQFVTSNISESLSILSLILTVIFIVNLVLQGGSLYFIILRDLKTERFLVVGSVFGILITMGLGWIFQFSILAIANEETQFVSGNQTINYSFSGGFGLNLFFITLALCCYLASIWYIVRARGLEDRDSLTLRERIGK